MTWVTICPRCRRNRAFNHAAGACYECAPQPKENDMPMCPQCKSITADAMLWEGVCRNCRECQTPRVATEIISKLEADTQKLLAELAAVKAESLRVVPDGEPCEIDYLQRHHYVQWEGHVCVPDKIRCELVRIADNYRYDVAQEYLDAFRFQPVRLVAWEAGK
jgi:hypothetical protein